MTKRARAMVTRAMAKAMRMACNEEGDGRVTATWVMVMAKTATGSKSVVYPMP